MGFLAGGIAPPSGIIAKVGSGDLTTFTAPDDGRGGELKTMSSGRRNVGGALLSDGISCNDKLLSVAFRVLDVDHAGVYPPDDDAFSDPKSMSLVLDTLVDKLLLLLPFITVADFRGGDTTLDRISSRATAACACCGFDKDEDEIADDDTDGGCFFAGGANGIFIDGLLSYFKGEY